MSVQGVPLDFDGKVSTPTAEKIRRLRDIPNIQSLEIPPVDFLAPGIIARNTITIWTGACGSGKSFLGMAMAVAVATGGEFLGRRCQRWPVLYLDFENPGYAIKDRLALLCDSPLDDLHVWGTWNEQSPPMIGSELLLTIAKESRPLLVIDPMRFAHTAEENDSTAMAGVMQCLKYCAAAGCAVVAMHHPGKAEGSQSRGSSVIRDHADACLLHEWNSESGLITLTWNKNRLGLDLTAVTIRPDFELGTFAISDSPAFVRRTEDTKKLLDLIAGRPGMSQNQIYQASGMKKERLRKLLADGNGSSWKSESKGSAILYFPLVPSDGNNSGNKGTSEGSQGCSPVPSLFRGNKGTAPPEPIPPSCSHGKDKPTNAKALPQCPVCESYDLYREPSGSMTCQSCEWKGTVQ